MAKLTTAEFIEAIKELSVMELNELVKACEEEFGVSAAAGVVVAAGPAAAAEEEKTEFDVELTDFGAQKIKVIKVVREISGRPSGRPLLPSERLCIAAGPGKGCGVIARRVVLHRALL